MIYSLKKRSLFIFINIILNFLIPQFLFAASLYLSPFSKNVNVGDLFSVVIFVNSADQAINAVSGEITWPGEMLELVNFSKSQSIVKFWVKEPEFLNNQISFEGVIFNPGYKGNNGKVLTLNFKALREGTAEVKFLSGMVLANDGQGTNILSMINGSSIVIKEKEKVKEIGQQVSETEPTVVPVIRVPKPEIFSPTHPDQQKWYKNNNPKFEWQVPLTVTEVRIGYGNDPYLVPQVSYSPPISKRQLNNVLDGSYYFAVQFVADNYLSEIARFKFNIDTQAPRFEEFSLNLIDQNLLSLKLRIKDELSGISMVNIYLDNQLIKKLSEINYYEEVFKDIKPGSHTVKVEAVDKAGNQEEKIEKIIIPESPQVIVEKDYTIYLILVLLALILIILIIWFYILRRKLDDVHKQVSLQRLNHIKKDLHNYFSQFLWQARRDLSLLDEDQQLSEQEKEVYRQIKKIIEEAEVKIKNILDKLK